MTVGAIRRQLALLGGIAGNPMSEETPIFVFFNKKDLFRHQGAGSVQDYSCGSITYGDVNVD